MATSKAVRESKASAIAWSIVIVLSLLFILNSQNLRFQDHQFSSRPNDLETISPKSLARAARMFALDIRVRDRDFPVDQMMQSPEWADLQRKLTLYSKKLETMETQEREFHDRLSTQLLVTSYLALAASIVSVVLRVRDQRRNSAPTDLLPKGEPLSAA